jgi:hypothetical protein
MQYCGHNDKTYALYANYNEEAKNKTRGQCTFQKHYKLLGNFVRSQNEDLFIGRYVKHNMRMFISKQGKNIGNSMLHNLF